MHECHIQSNRVTRVINMKMNNVQSFMINDLRPNINASTGYITLYFVQNHVVKENFSVQCFIFYPVYTIWLLVKIDFIVLNVEMRSYFKRKALAAFREVFDVHVESIGVVNLLLESFLFEFVDENEAWG